MSQIKNKLPLTHGDNGMVKAINAIDMDWLHKCNKHVCNKPLTTFFRSISHTGDGYLYVLMALIAIIHFDDTSISFLKVALVGFLFEIPSFMVLKNLLKRSRPYMVTKQCKPAVSPSDEFSMPSGHTAAAFLVAVVIAHFYSDYAIYAYLWATLIGFSRVFLGVHYPTDTIVGAALGCLCAVISIQLFV